MPKMNREERLAAERAKFAAELLATKLLVDTFGTVSPGTWDIDQITFGLWDRLAPVDLAEDRAESVEAMKNCVQIAETVFPGVAHWDTVFEIFDRLYGDVEE